MRQAKTALRNSGRFMAGVFAAGVIFLTAPAGAAGEAAFTDHGMAAQIGYHISRPMLTLDKDGEPVLFFELHAPAGDVRTTFMFINVKTGESEQLNTGMESRGRSASYLSSDNMVYIFQGNVFLQVDVENRTFRKLGEVRGLPRRVTECFNGLIYVGTYGDAELTIFNPGTGELKNHGPMDRKREWRQYIQVAVDDRGWVYGAIGIKELSLIAYHPETGERRRLLDERIQLDRETGYHFHRAKVDGKVYSALDRSRWWRLYDGRVEKIGRMAEILPAASWVEDQNMYGHEPRDHFPDGTKLKELSVEDKYLVVQHPDDSEPRRVEFDYEGGGVRIFSLAAHDGLICGSTYAPLRLFEYCPETGRMDNWGFDGHIGVIRAWASMGDKLYGGVYGDGLICYDPSKPVEDVALTRSSNPRVLYWTGEEGDFGEGRNLAREVFGRPFTLLAHPDGRHLVMGGNPHRTHTGGGILIYDVENGESLVITHENLLKDQGVKAVAAVEGGKYLVMGGTCLAATGGSRKAGEAEIGVFDWERRKMISRKVPVPGAVSVRDLLAVDDRTVCGITDRGEFFVLDFPRNEIVAKVSLRPDYGPLYQRNDDILEQGPGGLVYILFREHIVRLDPRTMEHRSLGKTPGAVEGGFAITGGRVYFSVGANLWSFDPDSAE